MFFILKTLIASKNHGVKGVRAHKCIPRALDVACSSVSSINYRSRKRRAIPGEPISSSADVIKLFKNGRILSFQAVEKVKKKRQCHSESFAHCHSERSPAPHGVQGEAKSLIARLRINSAKNLTQSVILNEVKDLMRPFQASQGGYNKTFKKGRVLSFDLIYFLMTLIAF